MGYRQIGIGKNGKRRYVFDLRVLGNRFRRLVTCPASAVVELYRRWEREIYDSNGSVIAKHKFFDIVKKYIEWITGKKTAEVVYRETSVLNQAVKFFGKKYLSEIKRHHIEEYLAHRRANPTSKHKSVLSAATINKIVASLSCFFNWCINREYITANPAQRLRTKEDNERVIHLTTEQIQELFTKAVGIMKRVVMLAIFTGMRDGSESCKLKWADVDLENGYISLWAHATKSKKRRTIPMPDDLLVYLRELRQLEPATEYVLSMNGMPMSYAQVLLRWNKLRAQLSFARQGDGSLLRLHDLRHVFAVLMRMRGAGLDVLKELLGHASMAMTLRYAHYQGDVGREKVKVLDGIITPPKAS
ncbi:MAG: site-specific integrase [Spirochaetota bacterium]